jgi:peptidyl-dipeptidase Dcp
LQELAGANLSEGDKDKMKKINEELASLGTLLKQLLIARKNGAIL